MRRRSELCTREVLRAGRRTERERRGGNSTERGQSSDRREEQNSGRGCVRDCAGGDPERVGVYGWRWRGRSSEDGGTRPRCEDGRGRDLQARRSGG